jgi:RHS repeat-associated protein
MDRFVGIAPASRLAPAPAQILAVGDDTSTPIEGIGHDYIKTLSETVNPANGSVSLRIQANPARARGITLPFSFNYDSNGVNHIVGGFQPYPESNLSGVSQGGWSYGLPLLQSVTWSSTTPQGVTCSFTSGYTFQDSSGGRHNLGLATASYSSGGPGGTYLCSSPVVNGGDQKYAASLVTTLNAGNLNPPVLVRDPDGTVYHILNGYPDYIEDRNGNKISFSSGALAEYIDTAGRTALALDGLGPSGKTNTITVSGMKYQATWISTTPNFTFPNKNVYYVNGYNCEPFLPANTAETVVNDIVLPNGEKYQFYYGTNNPHGNSNPYGLLSEIDYPTGAWVRYTWKMSDKYSEAVFFDGISVIDGSEVPGWCQSIYETPVVATRMVGFGSSPVITQTFTYSTTWNVSTWTTKQTTVSTTDNVRGLTSQTIYTYGSAYVGANNPYSGSIYAAGQLPLETQIQYYNWGNTTTPMRTVYKTWADPFDLASEQTVLNDDNNLTSQTTYSYTSGNLPQLKNKSEYDYGSTLLRSTVTNYQAFAATPIGGVIADKPCQTITYDGSNNRFAETDYFYDNGSATGPCGTAGTPSVVGVSGLATGTHDETNYGPTSSAPRGNLTQKTQWGSTGTSPVTTYTYDETGQVLSMTDPCGNGSCSDMTGSTHTTAFSYADDYTILSGGQNVGYTPTTGVTNTYLTKMTDALGFVDTFSYDYYSGQLTKSMDPNTQSTTYIYNDSFNRPTQVNYPDGGQTSLAYNDSPYNPSTPSPSVTTTKLITASVNEVSIAASDFMGRSVETILSSDPDGVTYTAATYDGMSRRYTVSNPYRTTGDSTYGITTYNYDALGRTTQVVDPDGSTVSTVYTGTQTGGAVTTVTDETGSQRTNQLDGLGRLTHVWEAPNNNYYNYQTVYAYDPLNNLLSVNQTGGSRTRTFTYDSLSRLLCAANPEVQIVTCPTSATGSFPAGAITYTYDLNGNLSSKIAPRPGQTTGTLTVTTNYSYDVVNRLTQKAYMGLTTSLAKFGYDGTILTACGQNPPAITSPTNLAGRRSAMCDGKSGSSWSYNSLGRPLLETRINAGGGNQTKYSAAYAYNLDGSLKMLTYPSGDVVSYTVGGAGRTTQVSDANNKYVGYTGNSAKYAPGGALASMTNGYTSTFAGIITSKTYNDRLQPILLSAGVSGQNSIFSLCYDFHLHVAVSSIPCNFNAYTTGNNGNVFQILNTVDSTRSASFTYDPLNRISQANTITTTGANCWGEVYTIDAWGNLTNRAGVAGMAGCSTEPLNAAPASSQNQLNGISYDIAGNVLNDGKGNTPTYDAENRIVTDAGVTYYYDADGFRMEKSSGTKYWPGPSGTLTETDLTGTINAEYIYFNGARIARVDRPSGTVHYYFSDKLGSASVITDAGGNVQQQYFYYPYGGLISSIGSDPNHYKFNGKERDAESNLDEFGARYYTSAIGRFMTPDWADNATAVPYANFGNPQSLNLYSFVENNPTTTGDPDGHCSTNPTTGGGGTDCGEEVNNYSLKKKVTTPPKQSPSQLLEEGYRLASRPMAANKKKGVKKDQGLVYTPHDLPSDFDLGALAQKIGGFFGLTFVSASNEDPKPIPLPADLLWIEQILNGHGWIEHGEEDFGSKEDYKNAILDTVQNATGKDVQHPDKFRTLYWNDKEGFAVWRNKKGPDNSTAYFPDNPDKFKKTWGLG